ncbi:serine hydrolase domain-containing protein [Allomuricauda sp. SCSIO 65647]|uniref:serine hydrolase domain-containing protein n=1 Tax=Allomuricauda sp. SCSIO 65647 TaxID=2908843 RepID=UPI001F2DD2A1|nr:serine hydrolase domain-containing protein [Muricauda sp. SCSIO 65647]UJH68241.1 beta-lactamase family protein [Muricauda sp. SCSIO 65647]
MASFLTYIKNLFAPTSPIKVVDRLSGIEKADALFQGLVAEKRVPGMAITILKEGETLLQRGYGFADLERKIPVSPKQTIFRIASISKCITGIALGKMVEEGLIDLDASFYRYVPDYPKKKYDFTIRQLAGHTAGIRGYRRKEFALNKPYSIKASIEVFKDDPLVFEPGKGYHYNSFDFVLLSLAMQEASGMSFEDYVKDNVLKPLAMADTFAPKNVETSFRAAREISISKFFSKTATTFKKAVEVDNFYKLAGGGYLSTSDDIARFGQAILGQKLLKPKTYEALLTSQMVNGTPTYYGLGFQVSQDASGRSFVGHVGNSVGAYTNFFVYPEQNMVISIVINCTNPKVQDILDKGIDSIFENNGLKEIDV